MDSLYICFLSYFIISRFITTIYLFSILRMKKFILKSITFAIIAIIIVSFILIKYGAYADYFYNKFTTPKAKSMILGDSRSFQGIQPKIINAFFDDNQYDLPMFNYSFTIAQISYNELYLQSIKRKIDKTTKNGLFILSVHPWVLSNKNTTDINVPPHNMNNVTSNPNYEYFIKNLNYFHFKSIFRQNSKLHKDGWLEERNIPSNKKILLDWKKKQIKMYQDFSKKWRPSKLYLKNLDSTVKFLKNYGKVVLVRMPVNNAINTIENNYWHNFDNDMSIITLNNNIKYISFVKDSLKYKTYDGNHIDKNGGVFFTKDLCEKIKNMLSIIPIEYYTLIYYHIILLIILVAFFHTQSFTGFTKETFGFNVFFAKLLFWFTLLYMGLRPISYVFGDMTNYNRAFKIYANGGFTGLRGDVGFYGMMKLVSYLQSAKLFFFIVDVYSIYYLFILL